jgi:hypothetical protein
MQATQNLFFAMRTSYMTTTFTDERYHIQVNNYSTRSVTGSGFSPRNSTHAFFIHG